MSRRCSTRFIGVAGASDGRIVVSGHTRDAFVGLRFAACSWLCDGFAAQVVASTAGAGRPARRFACRRRPPRRRRVDERRRHRRLHASRSERRRARSARTVVRVLAGPKRSSSASSARSRAGDGIVSFSVRRDAQLDSEDHIRLVLGPFLDGRSGYVFAVNPSGARYDGLINPGAKATTPIGTASGRRRRPGRRRAGASRSGFRCRPSASSPNCASGISTSSAAFSVCSKPIAGPSPARQYQMTQTSRAGLLTELPAFDLGLGLSVRPAVTTGGGIPRAGGERRRRVSAEPRRDASGSAPTCWRRRR